MEWLIGPHASIVSHGTSVVGRGTSLHVALVVGAYAVIHYTEPRYTKALDLWVEPTPENAHRVFEALRGFGAPMEGVAEADFSDPSVAFQIGIEPN